MKPEIRDTIRALVGLVERDVAELRDAVIEVDERNSRSASEVAAVNERMAKMTAAWARLDERLAELEAVMASRQ